ncbi:MAG TPA: exopolysaccharide biosynthesis protein [Gammaproteobacteria bacterium]|nr:exopolysaccharide biosynthesis protein [Gammaproteobacteria bacterium]
MASDHFKKALELARINTSRSSANRPRKVAKRLNDSISNQAISENDFKNLTYHKTQVQPVSPKQLRENRIIAGFPNEPNSSQFRILRTQVIQELRENGWNSVAITAAHSDAGKSLIAANLAVSLSLMTNITVLLVDLDLRKPSIHRYFDLDVEKGIFEHLTQGIPLENILINPGFERLVILPGSEPTNSSSELLASREAVDMLDEIKNRYESRVILYDLPPLLGIDDAMVILPHIDSSLLVVEANKTTEVELNQSLQVLEDHPLIGIVFNKADQLDVLQYGY